jgi:hypothetical protein
MSTSLVFKRHSLSTALRSPIARQMPGPLHTVIRCVVTISTIFRCGRNNFTHWCSVYLRIKESRFSQRMLRP